MLVLVWAAAAAATGCGQPAPFEPYVPHLSVSRILAFGDSLTEGLATPASIGPLFVHPTNDPGTAKGYPFKLLTMLTTRYATQTISVYNGGYGGRFLADDALDNPDRTLGEFLDAFNPEVMILLHGVNDTNLPGADVKAVAALEGLLIDKATARGTNVILSSLPPRMAGGNPERVANAASVVPFNAALDALAAQKGVAFVDIYSLMAQSLSGPDLAPDGLHLTEAANAKIATAYFDALRARYEISK
jgi:lysophospholipase L1-like esterase